MDHETPTPFDTVGDEPVEARIVAWVLGEASAFEAAELERLCEERPELLVFRRRMRALHGLLTEAEASEADHSWKLPPEKRMLLDEICGEERTVRLEVEKEHRIQRSGRRAWLAIAACVMLGVVVMQLIPRKYESKVTLEVKPRSSGMSPLAESGMKPQFFGTEFGKIKSNSSLEKVVDNLDLADRWKVDKQTAVKRLKENITTENVRGTALIDIRVRDAKKQDADEIAMEVTKAYKEYRSAIENRESTKALFELNKAVRDQEDKVEERRKVLATIVRTKGIIYKGEDSFYAQSGVDEDQAAAVANNDNREEAIKRGLDAQDYVDAKRDFETDQELLQQLKLKQIGETIASKMPDQSIAIVESPSSFSTASHSVLPAPAAAPAPVAEMAPALGGELAYQLKPGRLSQRAQTEAKESARQGKLAAASAKRLATADPQGLASNGDLPGPQAASEIPVLGTLYRNSESLEKGKLSGLSGGAGDSGQIADNTSGAAGKKSLQEDMDARSALPARKGKANQDRAGAILNGGAIYNGAIATTAGTLAFDAEDRKSKERENKGDNSISLGLPTSDKDSDQPAPAGASGQTGDRSQFSRLAGGAQGFGMGAEGTAVDSSGESISQNLSLVDRERKIEGDEITNGLRSGDQAVKRNDIDAILDDSGLPTDGVPLANAPLKVAPPKNAPSEAMPTLAAKDSITRGVRPRIVPPSLPSQPMAKAEGEDGFEGVTNYGAPIAGKPSLSSASKKESVVEKAIELRKGGKADDLREMQDVLAAAKSKNEEIRREMALLDDPIRSNAALTYQSAQNDDQVRRGLYTAEGNFNLGKLDDSKKAYEEILKTDPSNAAARRGLERVGQAKSEYYRAAYDHTRAELLSQVDSSLELAVPAEKNSQPDPEANGRSSQLEIIREFKYPTEYEPPTLPNPLALNTNVDANLYLQSSAASSDYYDSTDRHSFSAYEHFDLKKRIEEDGKPLGMEIGGANTFNYNLSSGVRAAIEPQAPALPDQSAEGEKLLFETKSKLDAAPDSAPSGEVAQKGAGKNQEVLESDSATDDLRGRELGRLAQKEMIRRSDTVAESDRLLSAARDDFAKGAYQEAYGKYESALKALPEAPLTKERRDFLKKSLGDTSVALASLAAKEGRSDESRIWYSKALEWTPDNEQARQSLVLDSVEEIGASENPYSTFSLNISDASFQLAKAALAKGERPDPASIKPEQFYNAVDYGDPAPSSNAPVASTIEQSAHPIIPGRNLVRVALRTASVGRFATQPLHLTLLVDQSGSMVREDRRAAMEQALKQLGGLLTKNDSVTIIGFSRTPHLLADALSGDQGSKLGDIINQTASEGGTNLEEAMKLGAQKAAEHQLAGAQNRIVLFTDGAANLGNANPERLANQVTALRQKGIAFDIAGIGADGLNDQLLGELARHGNGRYYVVGNEKNDSFAKQLAGAFRPAAENVKVQVNFNPQRVGKYKLIGFEKDRLKTEDFRNDSVDAAELAADEAGVAIYQVEPLAGGTGEIGEVSVRFRDVASSEMVERTWTIPYDSQATAFDRATPSMQLAGLSLLTAEKLKGGPMADAIDFKLLTEPAASVKQFYGASAPVADMLRMIDVLK